MRGIVVAGAEILIYPSFQDLRIDEVPAACACVQITIINQVLIRQDDGIARNAQLLCQLARRGQRPVQRYPPTDNGIDQCLAQLALQADR